MWYINKFLFRLFTLTPLTTTSIAPCTTSASVTASFNETSIAGQTSDNKLISISTKGNDTETTKSKFLTTNPNVGTTPTGFDQPTTTVKTKPDGNVRNFIFINCISLNFKLKFIPCMKCNKYLKCISEADANPNPWILGFAVKNQEECYVMMLSIVSLFLFTIWISFLIQFYLNSSKHQANILHWCVSIF